MISDEQLREWVNDVKSQGYDHVRALEDGTIVGTMHLLYTTAIFIGLTPSGWERRFCFDNHDLALEQVALLTSADDEPVGFIARRG